MPNVKIYYNILESKYFVVTHNFTFYFSSKSYKDKFEERLLENRKRIKYNLSSRYNIEINCNDYFDFILYSQLEKRGFRVVDRIGEIYTNLNQVRLKGEILNNSY